jgi:hypothetical protein
VYGYTSLPFWLASMPIGQSAAILVTLGVAISLLGAYVMNRIFTVAELEANNVVAGYKYTAIAEFYAVIIALGLVGAWEIYQNARDTVQREASSLYFLLQAAPTYSQPEQQADRQRMETSIKDYAKAVVERDWSNMQRGLMVPASDPEFNRLVRAFLDVQPTTAAQQALQQNTAQVVMEMNQLRIQRLSSVSRTLSGIVWVLIALGAFIVVAFPWFFGTVNQLTQAVMGALASVVMTGILLVAVKLAFPFAGEPLVTPAIFLTLMN